MEHRLRKPLHEKIKGRPGLQRGSQTQAVFKKAKNLSVKYRTRNSSEGGLLNVASVQVTLFLFSY